MIIPTQNANPTIIFGFGGLGCRIITQAKERLSDKIDREALSQYVFLGYDTDPNMSDRAPVENERGEMIRLGSDEYTFIGGFRPEQIINNPDRFPETIKRFRLGKRNGADKLGFSEEALTEGANQVRPLGALAVCYHYEKIRSSIRNQLVHIRRSINREVESRTINIFFVASMCGGTGSGILLDMVYIARDILKQELQINEEHIRAVAMLVTPEAFTSINLTSTNKIRANAYSLMYELDHYMTHRSYAVSYDTSDGRVSHVRSQAAPFLIVYPISVNKLRGGGVGNLNELVPIVAEALYLHGGIEGGKVNSTLVNIHQDVLKSRDPYGYVKGYSGIGVATHRFPAVKLQSLLSDKLCQNLLKRILLADNAQSQSLRITRDSLRNQPAQPGRDFGYGLTPDSLDRDLRAGGHLAPETDIEFSDNRFPHSIGARAVHREIRTYIRQEGFPQITDQIRQNSERLIEQHEYGLREACKSWCNDPSIGVSRARVRALTLQQNLEHQISAWDNNLAQQKLLVEEQERRLEGGFAIRGVQQRGTRAKFDEAYAQRISLRGRQNRRVARDNYLSNYKQLLAARLSVMVAEESKRILHMLVEYLDQIQSEMADLIDILSNIKLQIDQRIDRTRLGWQKKHDNDELVVAFDDTDHYYDRIVSVNLEDIADALYQQKSPGQWLEEVNRNLSTTREHLTTDMLDWLKSFALERFEPILNINVETVQLENSDGDQGRFVDRLIRQASPLITLKEMVADRQTIFGVYDDRRTIYATYLPPTTTTLISTNDPHSTTVLDTLHGYPLHQMTAFNQYAERFAYAISQSQKEIGDFFCFPVCRDEMDAIFLFAMARAVPGLIDVETQTGQYQVAVRERRENLGRDIRTATLKFKEFIKTTDNLTEEEARFRRSIYASIEQCRFVDAVEEIEAWIQKLDSFLSKQDPNNTESNPLDQLINLFVESERHRFEQKVS